RDERFYATSGRWALRDLPAGTYTVTATSQLGMATVEVAIADGQRRDGVALVLTPLVTVRGRVVDLDSGAPVPGLTILMGGAHDAVGSYGDFGEDDGERRFITDVDGRFEVDRVPVGRDRVHGFSRDPSSRYGLFRRSVVIPAGQEGGAIGELRVARVRVPLADRGGDLGFAFADSPDEADDADVELRVARVDRDGPAAAAGLRTGDVIVAIDGVDVRGERSYLARALL